VVRTLVIDPDPASRDALRRILTERREQTRSVETLAEGRRLVSEFVPDVVVVALDVPAGEESAMAFLASLAHSAPAPDAFALVAEGGLEAGVRAMRSGAADFLWRPVSEERVALLFERLAARRVRAAAVEELRVKLARVETRRALPGSSASWQAALEAIERAASAGDPALVVGETGTEQEEAARAIHALSPRGAGPFVRFQDADGFPASLPPGPGTVWAPGLERRSREAQAALLQLLERPNGFRAVLGVNEPPEDAVAAGRLDAALLETLGGRIVHLPPLRERGADVDLLARRFLEEREPSFVFEVEALDALRAHDWPGNVRELRDVVRRAAGLTDGPVVHPTIVLSLLAGPRARRRIRRRKPPVVKIAVGASLADVERRIIQKTLEFARGSKPKTAELLKLSLKTIYNKIKEYGLEH
jgi:DNA-binding NtrC family response regulator